MELGAIISSACVLSLLCVGLIIVGLLILARFASGGLRGAISGLTGSDDDTPDTVQAYSSTRRPGASISSNLRQRSNELDFDSALNRYQQGDTPPATDDKASPFSNIPRGSSQAANSVLRDDPDASSPLRRKRGRDNRSQDDYDFIFDEDDGI